MSTLILITELLLLNIPLLVIRSYISVRYNDPISVFLVKNILAILYGVTELYDCCYDIKTWRKDSKADKATGDDQHVSDVNGVRNKSFDPEAKKEAT